MTLEELLPELRKLGRADKLRAIQVLAYDVELEDSTGLETVRHYEVWSPYDSAGAAQQLMALLAQDRQSTHDQTSACL